MELRATSGGKARQRITSTAMSNFKCRWPYPAFALREFIVNTNLKEGQPSDNQ